MTRVKEGKSNIENIEYIRSMKNGYFSARNIFPTDSHGELKIAESENTDTNGVYVFKASMHQEFIERCENFYFNGTQARVPARFITHFGFQSPIVIKPIDEGLWHIRMAQGEKELSQTKRRFQGNVRDRYLFFDEETEKKLHIGDDNYYLKVIIINNVNDGSYITLEPFYSEDKIEDKVYDTLTRCPRYSFVRQMDKNGLYLPKTFRHMTGIRNDSYIPVWERSDGKIVIEGRPGICKKCGKHFSRYKRPISDYCEECNPTRKILAAKIVNDYVAKIKELKKEFEEENMYV